MKAWRLRILMIILIWALAWPFPAAGSQADTKTIQYSFTITNTSNKVVPETVFRTYAPVEQTSWQKVLQTDATYEYKAKRDTLGNEILEFAFSDLPPFGAKIVRIRSEIEMAQQPEKGLASGLSPKSFLQPEPFIESDNPEIIKLAEELKRENNLSTARAIFDWVAANIRYSGYTSKPQGALYALQQKYGDCTEYMALFVALCRAASIPARGVGGYIVEQNAILRPADYHNWAEFHHNGSWRVADPQKQKFMEDQQNYIAMRIIGDSSGNQLAGNSRFMIFGANIKVKMN